MMHQSTPIYLPSTVMTIEDWLTSLRQDFPALHSPQLEGNSAKLILETSSPKPLGLYGKWNPISSSWKMSEDWLMGLTRTLRKSLGVFPRRGTMQNGVCTPLPTQEHHTNDKDGGVWPTSQFATPQSRDYRIGNIDRWNDYNRSRNLNDQIGGSLNPDWVEWLMGLPIGWSSTEPLNQEQYAQWLDLIHKKEWWIQEPSIPRLAKGIKGRINRLKILGNGIVPSTLKVFLQMPNKKNRPYFQNRVMGFHSPSMPEESEGPCRKCKQIQLLGDGYCESCWDKKAAAARNYIEDEWLT